ncbi:TetR/AcrR family transcriptional regulator [Aeromonas encheleia]|uniref:TetR/AcrR family transcriptional regulator n=1 Tax=Aeromonas encheleia TaxID=73010 RepID=UPI001F5655D2|nr:TetR family transcriptional regulator [Aeromonas encheleia]UNP87504.1 TetR/AcrR family transcriptional regulator [Aeromonas encheleia]
MRVTKAQAQANRAHIVATAAKLFRERGYDGVGVADLMAAAGFTHGGFYKHFPAKADLMAEAATCGFEQSLEKTSPLDAPEFVRHYLSREHRDAPGDGCIMAALCADAARQPAQVKTAFEAGIEEMLARTCGLSDTPDAQDTRARRAKGIALMAQMVGAIMLSRACPDESPLADEILDACSAALLSRLSSFEEAATAESNQDT